VGRRSFAIHWLCHCYGNETPRSTSCKTSIMKLVIIFVLGFSAHIIRDILRIAFHDHWRAFFVYKIWPRCEHCGTIRGLCLEDSRTCYPTNHDPFDGKSHPDDPNRSQLLCRRCAEYHHEYWDDMWKDYYSGRL